MNEMERKLSGITKIKVEKIEYTWTICNYSSNNKKTGEYLASPSFSNSENENVTWCLILYPKGIREDFKDSISLYLELQSKRGTDDKYQVHMCLSAVNSKQEKKISLESEYLYEQIEYWGFPSFAKQSYIRYEANGFLPDNKLTITCNMIVGIENPHSTFQKEIVKDLKFNESLLLDDKEFTDTIIVARDKEFKVHKAILAAHSPVFMTMFRTEMREKLENKVDLTHVDGDVISELLHYLYTGKVKNFDEYLIDLLKIADKYDIRRLKCLIENRLHIKLNKNNAIEFLILADHYNYQELKQNVIKFIIAHKDVLIKSQEFETLKKSHLAVEVLSEMVISLSV